MKKKPVIAFMMATMLLCGCSALKPGLTRYTMPEEKQTTTVDTEVKSAVERMAAEKHVAPKLTDDFVSKYMDMDSFNELKVRTAAGIAATQDTAAMTEEEYQLWKDIIATKELNQYTVDDLEKKTTELNKILGDLAESEGLSISELSEKYGMTEEELNQFVNEQAEKYVEEEVDSETEVGDYIVMDSSQSSKKADSNVSASVNSQSKN